MAVIAITGTPVAGTKYTVTTASSADWASVSNSTYFFDLTDKLVHYKDSTGAIIELFGAAGLSYFTEAQNTTAPNATVPVDSLTAVTGTTDGDFAIIPKGAGALISQIPDGTITGGNKRGANSVDLQTVRTNASNVASGQYSVVLGYNCRASATNSIAIGATSYATAVRAIALGSNSFANGVGSVAMGNDIGTTTASGVGSVAMGGVNTTASGGASTAFGGGIASNDASFAVAYGNASGFSSVAMGGQIGGGAAASGNYSFALGSSTRATGAYSMAMLWNSDTFSHRSRLSYGTYVNLNGSPAATPIGAVQGSTLVVGVDTNSVTPASLANYNGLVIALVLQNNNSIRFKGTIIARQTGSTNTSAWDIDGFIQRGTTAATTTLLISNINVVQNTPAWTTPTLTADTSTGGLDIKVTGVVTNLIRWTCVLTTTEVVIA